MARECLIDGVAGGYDRRPFPLPPRIKLLKAHDAGEGGVVRRFGGLARRSAGVTRVVKALLRLRGRLLRPYLVRRYLGTTDHRCLEIGCGDRVRQGWLGGDILPRRGDTIYLDAERKLPFGDETFRHVYAEHLIEHVPYRAGKRMLCECLRILEPGGRLRIVTPDLHRFLSLFAGDKSPEELRSLEWYRATLFPDIPEFNEVHALNGLLHAWGHRFIYDRRTLETAMSLAGFEDVRLQEYGRSVDPRLCDLESHGQRVSSPEIDAFEVMIFEGRRPR